MTDALERTQQFEGCRLKPYLDCCSRPWRECVCPEKGVLTIGVGCNLDQGISALEAHFLFQNRMKDARDDLNYHIPGAAAHLNDARYAALWDLVYNLGIGRLLGFKNMLTAIKVGDWQRAHDELLYADPSKGNRAPNPYWLDVGDGPGGKFDRAERNAKILLTGEWS